MLRIHDTAIGEVVPLEPRDPGKVSMYICGPTVYEVPHIGHGRFTLVFDVLRRYLEWRGFEVTYVSNITDIDDQIINRAVAEGRTAEEVATEYEAVWWAAMERLGVKAPTHDPHATAYVDQMVTLIGELVDRGKAYETSDGVYLSTETVPDYGLLARQPLESLRAGGGERTIVGEAEKASPLDFAVWKKAKEGEPAWPSPWGDGRPGWHTECVAMSLDLLGEGFDLHGGGRDLAFPHHENERAQAVALGKTFARRWMHNGWVEVEGVKMSKSLKNFTSLVDLVERHDPRAYRLLILRSHYRSPLEVTPDTIVDAEEGLARLDAVTRRFPEHLDSPIDQDAVARFNALMDDDLKTPEAMGLVFALVRQANTEADAGNAEAARSLTATVVALSGALGLELRGRGHDAVDDETTALMAERDAARASRDFARADTLRRELEQRGWTVEDTAAGTRVHR